MRQQIIHGPLEAQNVAQEAGVEHGVPEGVVEDFDRVQGVLEGFKLHVGKASGPQGSMIDPRSIDQGAPPEQMALGGFDVAAGSCDGGRDRRAQAPGCSAVGGLPGFDGR